MTQISPDFHRFFLLAACADFRRQDLVEDLSKLTVAQLKDMLKEKGLKVGAIGW